MLLAITIYLSRSHTLSARAVTQADVGLTPDIVLGCCELAREHWLRPSLLLPSPLESEYSALAQVVANAQNRAPRNRVTASDANKIDISHKHEPREAVKVSDSECAFKCH